MTNWILPSDCGRMLGVIGLFLMLVTARLAERGYAGQPTVAARLLGFLARRAIDGVATIGWLVDRLPLVSCFNFKTGGV